MALKLNLKLDNGISLEGAYIKVVAVGGTKEQATIETGVFVDYNYTDDKFVQKKFYTFVPSIDEDSFNWIKQSYNYLKTLDEYKNAEDILEVHQTQ